MYDTVNVVAYQFTVVRMIVSRFSTFLVEHEQSVPIGTEIGLRFSLWGINHIYTSYFRFERLYSGIFLVEDIDTINRAHPQRSTVFLCDVRNRIADVVFCRCLSFRVIRLQTIKSSAPYQSFTVFEDCPDILVRAFFAGMLLLEELRFLRLFIDHVYSRHVSAGQDESRVTFT